MSVMMSVDETDGEMYEDYCNLCGKDTMLLTLTHDDKTICQDCVDANHMCEVCGSLRGIDQTADEQLHYDEECFK